jgi:hypothetical protein
MDCLVIGLAIDANSPVCLGVWALFGVRRHGVVVPLVAAFLPAPNIHPPSAIERLTDHGPKQPGGNHERSILCSIANLSSALLPSSSSFELILALW